MEMVKNENPEQETATKKKKSRGIHVIRVVLFMLRRRGRKPFKSGFWRRLVESVRHFNKPSDVITVLPPPEDKAAAAEAEGGGGDAHVEQLSETVEGFTAASSSASSGISGYGSAMSLRDMDCQDYDDDDDDDDYGYDDDDDGHCYGGEGGDDMIDAKAEEFIANFYAQMRMQNQAYTEHFKAKRV